MKKRDDKFFILNIADALNDIQQYASVDFSVFQIETMRQDAIMRKFEILGEATKNVSAEFKQSHSEFDWKGMAGFRDVLIHQYFGINITQVWEIAKEKVPELIEKIHALPEYNQALDILKESQDM